MPRPVDSLHALSAGRLDGPGLRRAARTGRELRCVLRVSRRRHRRAVLSDAQSDDPSQRHAVRRHRGTLRAAVEHRAVSPPAGEHLQSAAAGGQRRLDGVAAGVAASGPVCTVDVESVELLRIDGNR